MTRSAVLVSLLAALAAAQTPVGNKSDSHPRIQTWKCSNSKGCQKQNSAIVLDSASHWVHQVKDTTKGCGSWGSPPPADACPDEETCAKNCVMEPVTDYSDYGVTTKDSSLTLNMYGKNGVASPRVYLLSENKKSYEMLKLTGQEFTFDVDVSKLPCGMNGALYLSEMEADGGQSKLNPGGAEWGTGYCDAQCFVTPWINGVGNVQGKGACCNELDIWEANRKATHLAPHPCNKPGLYQGVGDENGPTGVCDKNGCAGNPYRVGDKTYYGTDSGFKVDTSKPFTVITQFPEKNGVLQEIRRMYVQGGKVIQNAMVNVTGNMNDEFCAKNGAEMFGKLGAMKGMGEAMSRGMVLAFSIWWDEGGFMKWLDSGDAGPCNATEGDPKVIPSIEPRPVVTFSQIKWGEIGSTYNMRRPRPN